MANKKAIPPKHTQFKPGVSGNPLGKPKQLLTADKVSSIVGKFCLMNREELQKLVQDPKSTMLEVTVASILARAAKDGDYSRLEALLQRTIGKVKDTLEVFQPDPFIIKRLNGEIIEMGITAPKELPEPE